MTLPIAVPGTFGYYLYFTRHYCTIDFLTPNLETDSIVDLEFATTFILLCFEIIVLLPKLFYQLLFLRFKLLISLFLASQLVTLVWLFLNTQLCTSIAIIYVFLFSTLGLNILARGHHN